MLAHRAWVLLATPALCACAGSHFGPTGYRSQEAAYSIRYLDDGRLLPAEWRLLNFAHDGAGPTEPKTRGDYESEIALEGASGEPVEATTTTYELLFAHTTNARIWVRLLPIPARMRNSKVQFAAENWVNNLSGSVLTDFFRDGARARRIASTIQSSRGIGVRGRHAQLITFDIVDLDQLEANESAPRTRVSIVLVNAELTKVVEGASPNHAPAYLLLGYSNDAASFAQHSDLFAGLVQRVTFGKR